ncbi:hypothetical protein AB0D45_25205 [Streptomyces sp. NPDC048352]|uniref:hypothetical protein n=1 Tax=Streptomyces sp. NPDC048352 TaxID=3154718 RepID=UPI003414491B
MKHRHLTLLAAPLLISAATLTPAFAAPAALPAASCELVATGEGRNTSYTLVLEGFEPGQSVTIKGPRTDQRTRVGDEGTLDKQGVRYGKYTVNSKGNRIGCITPARGEHDGGGKQGKVKVTKVEVVTLTKPGTVVDCSKPNKAAFDGRITGTGKGDVDYYWTYASSSEPFAKGTAHFDAGTQGVSLLKVVELSPTVNGASQSVFMTLHVPSANLSARSDQVTLTCAKP